MSNASRKAGERDWSRENVPVEEEPPNVARHAERTFAELPRAFAGHVNSGFPNQTRTLSLLSVAWSVSSSTKMSLFHDWIRVLCLSSLCLSSAGAYEDICKDRGYLDSCLEQLPPLMSRNGTTGIPNSKKQVDAVCSAFKKGMRCIDLYSETCLSSSVRQIINENVAGARHTFAFLCDDPLFQSEYLQYSPCYRAVTRDWDLCAKRFLRQLPPQNSTSKRTEIETCCAKQTFYRCVYEFGNMRCRSDAASFLRRIAETLLNVHIYRMSCFPEESYDIHCASSKCGSSHSLSNLLLLAVCTGSLFFYFLTN